MEYNKWLTSNNIVKRSLAVFGHFLIGYFIVAGATSILALILIAIFG